MKRQVSIWKRITSSFNPVRCRRHQGSACTSKQTGAAYIQLMATPSTSYLNQYGLMRPQRRPLHHRLQGKRVSHRSHPHLRRREPISS